MARQANVFDGGVVEELGALCYVLVVDLNVAVGRLFREIACGNLKNEILKVNKNKRMQIF